MRLIDDCLIKRRSSSQPGGSEGDCLEDFTCDRGRVRRYEGIKGTMGVYEGGDDLLLKTAYWKP